MVAPAGDADASGRPGASFRTPIRDRAVARSYPTHSELNPSAAHRAMTQATTRAALPHPQTADPVPTSRSRHRCSVVHHGVFVGISRANTLSWTVTSIVVILGHCTVASSDRPTRPAPPARPRAMREFSNVWLLVFRTPEGSRRPAWCTGRTLFASMQQSRPTPQVGAHGSGLVS